VSTGEPAPAAALAQAVFPVTATLGDRQATVAFAALSADSVGLFQVDLVVPPLNPGSQPLVVTVNGVSSNKRFVTVDNQQR
jgi:uncharacterized protein (TIGR03437 family)